MRGTLVCLISLHAKSWISLEPIYKDGEAIWDSLKMRKLLVEASCAVEIDSLGMQSFTTRNHEDEILDDISVENKCK